MVFVCGISASGLCGCGQALEVELVGISFTMNLRHDVLVIIVPEGEGELGLGKGTTITRTSS